MKNFKLKPKIIEFSSSKFMTEKEKSKTYNDFIKFLNNHFKRTLFTNRLYEHFHLHCGFIAHYNINGFYGEYFYTAAKYHKLLNGYMPVSEYIGYIDIKPYETLNESFINIHKEINTHSYEGLGGFYTTIMSNKNYGGYSDYSDLDDAIKKSFKEYMFELNKVINKLLDEEETCLLKRASKIIEKDELQQKQTYSLFNVESTSEEPIKEIVPIKYIQKSLFDF